MNCYILIGGTSSRMGQSKVTLFLDRVSAAARGAFEEVFAVQRAGGRAADGMETIFETSHALRLHSGQAPQAPVFGVARALAHADGKCFILGVDYPLLTPSLLLRLRERFESSAALLLAPRCRGKLQMLCAGYDPALLARLEQRIAAGRLDLRGLVAEVDAEIVEESSDALMNVNTPEELEEARRLYEA